jgi:hypothetical protein
MTMITFQELNTDNHKITELSNVLLYLFKDRSMCDTESCCELFNRYLDMVRNHIELVDTHLYEKLLSHADNDIRNTVNNFMSGSQEIKKIMKGYTKTWCPKKPMQALAIADHNRFLKDSEEMFNLVLQRIQNETEKLYPLIRKVSGDIQHAA